MAKLNKYERLMLIEETFTLIFVSGKMQETIPTDPVISKKADIQVFESKRPNFRIWD